MAFVIEKYTREGYGTTGIRELATASFAYFCSLLPWGAGTQGTEIDRYFRTIRQYYSSSQGVYLFFRGRSGLFAILRALGVTTDDEVVVPGFTCIPVPNAVVFTGAKPVFADIEENSVNVSLQTVKPCISKRTKVIIVQHTFGAPVTDIDQILALCRNQGITLIEDCCHALGISYNGRRLGTYGDAAFFSTERSKMISTIYGGITIVNDPHLSLRVREIVAREFLAPDESQVRSLLTEFISSRLATWPSLAIKLPFLGYYTARAMKWKPLDDQAALNSIKADGYNRLLSSAQARIGISQFRRLPLMLSHRKNIASYYDCQLKRRGYPSLTGLSNKPLLRYPLTVENPNELMHACARSGIALGRWFESCVHPAASNTEKIAYHKGQCSNAERLAARVINLPTHPGISLRRAHNILEKVLGILNGVL